MKITGTMINYYFVCQRKLWFFIHQLRFEEGHENVELGKLLDQGSYSRENKQIMIEGTIAIDFIKDWKVLHEVKKSRAIEESAEWQVKYYLYFLKKRGIEVEKGVLDYPNLRQRKDVYLTNEDQVRLATILAEIEKIGKNEEIPTKIDSKICKKCAYYEFCYC